MLLRLAVLDLYRDWLPADGEQWGFFHKVLEHEAIAEPLLPLK